LGVADKATAQHLTGFLQHFVGGRRAVFAAGIPNMQDSGCVVVVVVRHGRTPVVSGGIAQGRKPSRRSAAVTD
jgi:hypothetical protein